MTAVVEPTAWAVLREHVRKTPAAFTVAMAIVVGAPLLAAWLLMLLLGAVYSVFPAQVLPLGFVASWLLVLSAFLIRRLLPGLLPKAPGLAVAGALLALVHWCVTVHGSAWYGWSGGAAGALLVAMLLAEWKRPAK